MTARRRAIVGVVIGAWLTGWALVIGAAAGLVALLWPALPGWIVPALGVGGLLIIEATKAKGSKVEAEKMAIEARKGFQQAPVVASGFGSHPLESQRRPTTGDSR